ncbi:hypothetical protein E6H14_07890 [Candidatus Bathyarchaeota archaeon]|nr:MAG: hypothetical protein E6H14_07890 [Candidatus Bathyarchaeota archaeon]
MRQNRFSLFIGPLASFNLPDVPFLLAAGLLLASLALSIREDTTAIAKATQPKLRIPPLKPNDSGGSDDHVH